MGIGYNILKYRCNMYIEGKERDSISLDKLFEILNKPTTVHEDYIVTLKYIFKNKFVIKNEVLVYNPNIFKNYRWLNNQDRGQNDVEVLGYISVHDIQLLNQK